MSLHILRLLLCPLLALLLTSAAIESIAAPQKVYVYKDKNGNTVFSDKPRPGAKEVKLKTNTLTMPSTETDIFDRLQSEDQNKPIKYQITVNQPEPQATIRNNSGMVNVSGVVSPALKTGFKVQLKIDGKAVQKPHSTVVFVLRDVDRGEHNIVLELIDAQGKTVTSSEPRTFYMFRASVLH